MQQQQRVGNTMRHLPAAGLIDLGDDKTSKQCVQPDLESFNQRPATPQGIKKWRKSYQRAPGRHFYHEGLVGQQLPPEHFRYGVTLSTGDRAADCLEQIPTTGLQDFYNNEREAQYDSHIREPLGKSYNRGHKLADATQDPSFRFGLTSNSSENSKSLIYYDDPLPDKRVAPEAPQRDPRFHREADITRAVNRNYDWASAGIDPARQRFGLVDKEGDDDGVESCLSHQPLNTTITSKRVNEIRNYSHDRIGQAREVRGTLRQLGSDFAFGRASTPDEWGSRKCIGGGYTVGEQMPDKDLGVSTRRLDTQQLPPFTHEHVYGTPSIRADIPAPRLRSVADPQNYGDEHNAQGLLYPSKTAYDGVHETEFTMERRPEEIREIFRKMNQEFSDSHFKRICDIAVRDFQVLSCDAFRHAYNKLRINGTAARTLSANGVLSPLASQNKPELVGIGF